MCFNPPQILGSLLSATVFVAKVGLYVRETTYMETVCDSLMNTLEHKNAQIQLAAMGLVPILAATDPLVG